MSLVYKIGSLIAEIGNGKPTPTQVAKLLEYYGKAPIKGCKTCGSAVKGLKNYILGIDRTTTEVYAQRMLICKQCEMYLRKTDQCFLCKCFLNIRANLKSFGCSDPAGDKWK